MKYLLAMISQHVNDNKLVTYKKVRTIFLKISLCREDYVSDED